MVPEQLTLAVSQVQQDQRIPLRRRQVLRLAQSQCSKCLRVPKSAPKGERDCMGEGWEAE